MPREIAIKPEHRQELDYYIEQFKHFAALQLTQQEKVKQASDLGTRLSKASQQLSKLNLGVSDEVVCRNAEILTYFLQEVREASQKANLYENIVQALRESLSLFLADAYGIDVTKEWNLDIGKGVLTYDEPG